MPKTFEILKYFPEFHQALDRKKLLYHVVDAIASRIHEIENDMIGVMKSHWIEAAEDIDDLEKIAALYGIQREDEDLSQFRTKVKDTISLYLAGPGTVPSTMGFIEIALRKYMVEMEKDEEGDIVVIHPVDGDEFRSKSRIYFDGEEDYVEIRENPLVEKGCADDAIRHGMKWFLNNRGFFDYYPEFTLRGYDSRTINPVLFNRSTGHALGFRGVIPWNGVLKITAGENGNLDAAELDGADVKNRVFSLKGSQFDKCSFDDKDSKLAVYQPAWAFNEIGFAESPKGNENAPVFDVPIPSNPVGESQWEFRIAGSEFNRSKFDDDAFTFPGEPEGVFDVEHFDGAVFQFDTSAGLEMKWEEHQRAMFEVILPCTLGVKQINSADAKEQKRQFAEPLQRISRMVELVKPAGVKVFVKYGDDGWILGDSVLRSSSASEGAGVDCKSTSITNK